ncbi:putative MFS family arabinose efflux permease [Pantoea alhagi]|uniref:MFS transporter n=1 Tax=Mixta sp. BE291 TaxID=3158787 RepID=UPI002863E037|nr:putative MFS family arabinose efflux permease [Pantoea alhagi]
MSRTATFAAPTSYTWRRWLAVVALGISAFTIVTSELAPIGLLSALAQDFNQPQASTGIVVTAYAWVAAVAALLSGALPQRISRRLLLTGLMLLLALSCLAVAWAGSFNLLLAARITGALAHGAFWALIGTVAAQLVPPARLGLATAIIFGGVSAASVAGVPLTNFLAHVAGWRSAFTLIAAIALLTACVIAWSVPQLKAAAPLGLRALWLLLTQRAFLQLYFATACVITAHFAAFTWIEPLLSETLRLPASLVSILLLVFGLAGVGGNVVAGKFIDRHLKGLAIAALVLAAAAVALLAILPVQGHPAAIGLLLLGWGTGIAVIFVGFQTWLLRLAGEAAQAASAIYVAIFNAAIGLGALAGSLLLRFTSVEGVLLTASAAIMFSLAPVLLLPAPARN